jgi:hypothetical protein
VANLTVYFKQTPVMSDYLQSFSYNANILLVCVACKQHYVIARLETAIHCLKSDTYTYVLVPLLEWKGFFSCFRDEMTIGIILPVRPLVALNRFSLNLILKNIPHPPPPQKKNSNNLIL